MEEKNGDLDVAFQLIPAVFMLVAYSGFSGRQQPSGVMAWISVVLSGLVDAACFRDFLLKAKDIRWFGHCLYFHLKGSNSSLWGVRNVGTVIVRWASKYSGPIMATRRNSSITASVEFKPVEKVVTEQT
ncbi:hypothetical protein C5167_003495 [Papaver somniferum]|uniref:Uncharacterized protein n=1 Tax=Papaver somniferum TaxID=3469 RepID=A0A4Y7L4W7_PAPSO|nr:hypothetical protein C5167_003495 [Papaver somniferum]